MPSEKTPPPAGQPASPRLPDNPGPTAAETLAAVSARLLKQHRLNPSLFRVVEVTRDAYGRLCRRGQIWHPDLSTVRRFGRALAANSDAQKVEVSDARGKVIETLTALPTGAPPAGWGDWRAMPLPPMPPPAAPARRPALRPVLPPLPPPALLDPETEVETTQTL